MCTVQHMENPNLHSECKELSAQILLVFRLIIASINCSLHALRLVQSVLYVTDESV